MEEGHELTEVGRERLRSVGVDGSVRGRIRHDMSQLRRIAPKKHCHAGGHQHRRNHCDDQYPVDVPGSSVHGQVRE